MSDRDSSHVQMLIECPECHKKMLLQVGLEPDTTKNEINCIRCHHAVIPLVPDRLSEDLFQWMPNGLFKTEQFFSTLCHSIFG